MVQKFRTYIERLERLSSAELDRSAEKLVVAEKTNLAKLTAHIAEMSARKAALELGDRNLFEYCVARLNLSEGAVPARIHVANVSRRFPQLLAALAEDRISLTVASLLGAHVREDNVEKLISDCAGKTRKETEEYRVALRPKPVFEPSVRKRPSPARASTPAARQDLPANGAPAASRHVPSAVAERVHARGAYQCEYRAPDGRRCTARRALQIDHARPYGIFLSHDERFLRLLCPAHNRLAAERVYGAGFIQRKIDARRAAARAGP